MGNNLIYNLHDFRDVSDDMNEVIQNINMYKNDYKIEEANQLAESNKEILGDMCSPTAINEIEQGLVNVQKMIIAKKKSVIINPDCPFMINNQSWIQPIADGHTHNWIFDEYSIEVARYRYEMRNTGKLYLKNKEQHPQYNNPESPYYHTYIYTIQFTFEFPDGNFYGKKNIVQQVQISDSSIEFQPQVSSFIDYMITYFLYNPAYEDFVDYQDGDYYNDWINYMNNTFKQFFYEYRSGRTGYINSITTPLAIKYPDYEIHTRFICSTCGEIRDVPDLSLEENHNHNWIYEEPKTITTTVVDSEPYDEEITYDEIVPHIVHHDGGDGVEPYDEVVSEVVPRTQIIHHEAVYHTETQTTVKSTCSICGAEREEIINE